MSEQDKLMDEMDYYEKELNCPDLSESTETVGYAPPLGLKPKHIHDSQRKNEICGAIVRYLYAGKEIPREWVEELSSLIGA